MTQQEKNELAVLAKTDEMAFESLLKQHEKMIASSARRYIKTLGWDNAVQCGRIALWKAVRGYKGERPFILKGYLMSELSNTARKETNAHVTGKDDKGKKQRLFEYCPELMADKCGSTKKNIAERAIVMNMIRPLFSEKKIKWFEMWLDGGSMATIAEAEGVSRQHIDFCVNEVRNKLTKLLS